MEKAFETFNLPCNDCSNEPLDRIPLARIIDTLDRDYAKNDLISAERHLTYWIREARQLNDKRSELSLCNEMIGLCRRTHDKNAALTIMECAIKLIEDLGVDNTLSAGTILLNGATTYEHFGDYEKALELYSDVERIYDLVLSRNSYEYAALYNNKAGAMELLHRYSDAESLLLLALSVLDACGTHVVDKAISYAGLARLAFLCHKDRDSIDQFLDMAWSVLTDSNVLHDGLYAYVCSKVSEDFFLLSRQEEAIALAEVAKEIYEGT